MLLYLAIFFVPVFFYYLSGKSVNSTFFLLIYISGLCLFVGLGDMLGGYDRYIYGEIFDNTADQIKEGVPFYETTVFIQYPKEVGFGMINVLISYITSNRYIYILILTILIYSSLFVLMKQYVENAPFAMIIFMALMFYFTFTYLRQLLAVSVIWYTIPFVYKRKFWLFLLFTLLAISIHNGIVLYFLFYFIPVKKYSRGGILTLMFILFALGISGISSFLYSMYGDVSGDVHRLSVYDTGDTGIRFAYLIEALFFLYYILENYDYLGKTKLQIVLLNMSLAFCGILLLFIRSENGGRLSWCFTIAICAVLAELSNISRRRDEIATILIIVCFFLYVRVYNAWQVYMNLYPYKTFLTDGHRKGDPVWDLYEYDEDYDDNKFYR